MSVCLAMKVHKNRKIHKIARHEVSPCVFAISQHNIPCCPVSPSLTELSHWATWHLPLQYIPLQLWGAMAQSLPLKCNVIQCFPCSVDILQHKASTPHPFVIILWLKATFLPKVSPFYSARPQSPLQHWNFMMQGDHTPPPPAESLFCGLREQSP